MKLGFKRKRNGQEGQAAIEFIFIVIGVLFFLLFFLSLSILLVVSDYIEYATFMAARTYKSMSISKETQQQRAQNVFDAYTSRIQGIARDFKIAFLPGWNGANDLQSEGMMAQYSINLFYLPPFFVPDEVPPSTVQLTTRTRLGRDVSYQECLQYFRNFADQVNFGVGGSGLTNLMDDNGC